MARQPVPLPSGDIPLGSESDEAPSVAAAPVAAALPAGDVALGDSSQPTGRASLLDRYASLKDLGEAVSSGVQGLASGPGAVYDALNLPTNAIRWFANKAYGTNLPMMPASSDIVKSVVGATGLPAEPPPTVANEVVRDLAGVASGGLLAGTARAIGGRALAESAPVVDRFLRAMSSKPLVQVGTGVGQGVGDAIVRAPDVDNSPAVRVALPIATSLLGAGAAGAGGSLLGAAFRAPGAVDTAATRVFLNAASDPAGAVDRILGHVPDPTNPMAPFQSTAEVAGDLGLINLERSAIRGGAAGPTAQGDFIANDVARAAQGVHVMDQIAPPGAGAQGVADWAAEQRRAAADAVQRATGGFGPAGAVEDVGQGIQDALIPARAASRRAASAAFEEIDPGGTTAIPLRPIRLAARDVAIERFGPDATLWPSEARQLVSRLGDDNMTLLQLQNLRSSLDAGGGNAGLQQVYRVARQAIGEQIDDAAATGTGGVTPRMAMDLTRAQAGWRQHMETFANPTVERITATKFGEPTAGPASVPGQVFKPGPTGADTMERFNRAALDPATGEYLPALDDAMRQHLAAHLAPLAGPDGAISPEVLGQWTRNYSPAIRQLPPSLRQQVTNTERAGQLVADAGGTPTAPGDPNQNALSLFLNRNPADAIDTAFRSRNSLAQFADLRSRVASSPQAFADLRRAVLENAQQRMSTVSPAGASGTDVRQSADAALKWWRANAPTLQGAGLFTPDETRQLGQVFDSQFSRQRIDSAGRVAGSPTSANLSTMQLMDMLLQGSSVPSWASPSTKRAAATLLNLPWVREFTAMGTDRARARIAEMALDPQIAANLIRKADPDVIDRLTGRMSELWPNFPGIFGRATPALAGQARGQ